MTLWRMLRWRRSDGSAAAVGRSDAAWAWWMSGGGTAVVEEWRCTGAVESGDGAAVEESQRRRAGCSGGAAASRGLGHGVNQRRHARGRRKRKKTDEWLKQGSDPLFHGVTGRADRLTGRATEASGQSPVSSWRNRTRLVRGDRTRTESGQRSTQEPIARDRAHW
jgi:hypothetical protein